MDAGVAWRPADAGTTAGLRGHQHGDHSLIRHHYTFYLYAARMCWYPAAHKHWVAVLGPINIAAQKNGT